MLCKLLKKVDLVKNTPPKVNFVTWFLFLEPRKCICFDYAPFYKCLIYFFFKMLDLFRAFIERRIVKQMHFRGSKNRNNVTKFTLGGAFFTISKKVVLPLPFTPPTITTSNDRSHICITHICTPFLIYVTVVNLGGGGRGLIQPFSNLWAILETFIKKNHWKHVFP